MKDGGVSFGKQGIGGGRVLWVVSKAYEKSVKGSAR